jgi:hypothetical protein
MRLWPVSTGSSTRGADSTAAAMRAGRRTTRYASIVLFEKAEYYFRFLLVFCGAVSWLGNCVIHGHIFISYCAVSHMIPSVSMCIIHSLSFSFDCSIHVFHSFFPHTYVFSLPSGRLHDSLARAFPALQIAAGDGGRFVSHGRRGNAVGHRGVRCDDQSMGKNY